jgi:hypothetical protein
VPKPKPNKPNPNAARNQWLRVRVNEHEAATVQAWLTTISPDRADVVAQEIADRLAQRATFPNVGELLRCILDLPEIKVGAPEGNQNAARKLKSS